MAGSTRNATAIALGMALREAREQHGVSQRKLAKMLDRNSGTLSRWESGEFAPKPQEVTEILVALGIGGEQASDLLAMASGAGAPRWVAVTLPERRQQLVAILNAERTATVVTHVAPLLIPGVLQTGEVIRSIMERAEVAADEIDERVAVRIGRRDLITRREPAQLDVFLGEAAIRHKIGSPQIMADQLRYLLELGELPNVKLCLMPFDAGWGSHLTGGFILFDSNEVPSITHVEMQRSGMIFHDPDDIETYRQSAEMVREMAMNPTDTAGFIAKVLSEMENTT